MESRPTVAQPSRLRIDRKRDACATFAALGDDTYRESMSAVGQVSIPARLCLAARGNGGYGKPPYSSAMPFLASQPQDEP